MAKNSKLETIIGYIKKIVSAEKITQRIEKSIDKVTAKAESSILKSLDRIHRKILASLLEGLVLIGSLVLLLIGLVMIINDYIPTRYLFIIIGICGMITYIIKNIRISFS